MRRVPPPFPALPVLLGLALCLGLSACGYSLASRGPSALKDNQRKLYLVSVENPSLDTWVGPELRSRLRDEINNRHVARWTERSNAQGLVEVVIDRFTTSETTVTGESDQSLRYAASISVSMHIVSPLDGSVLWSSGSVGASESFYGKDAASARERVVRLAVERMVDRLSENY
ncbi:MAG: LPS assembly lipoprotein LptE [Desulfovibrionaceae bacterium]